MTTIRLEDVGVFSYTATVSEARAILDGELMPDLESVLDSAQGYVRDKLGEKAWLVIEIIPDGSAADEAEDTETSAA